MSKEREKDLIKQAESELDVLITEKKISLEELRKFQKILQKLNSNAKKKEESQKNLDSFLTSNPEIAKILKKLENNKVILDKSCQRIISKNQVDLKPNDSKKIKEESNSKIPYKIESIKFKDFIKNGKPESNTIYIFFETLTEGLMLYNKVPLFTMIFDEGDNLLFYFAQNGETLLDFSQFSYLVSDNVETLFGIEYLDFVKKGEDPETNIIKINEIETKIKEVDFCKGKKIEIKYFEGEFNGFKDELKKIINEKKNKIKTNNKDLINKLFE